MKQIALSTLLLALLASSSCYYDKEEELYPNNGVCDTTSISYATNIEPIIDGKCATSGCHVGGGSGNGIFDSYNAVKAKVDNGSFANRVLVVKDMPPSGLLTECQLKWIELWIAAGAPNN